MSEYQDLWNEHLDALAVFIEATDNMDYKLSTLADENLVRIEDAMRNAMGEVQVLGLSITKNLSEMRTGLVQELEDLEDDEDEHFAGTI